jgi:hypothetical protein
MLWQPKVRPQSATAKFTEATKHQSLDFAGYLNPLNTENDSKNYQEQQDSF